MPSLTIPNLDEELQRRLRLRAAEHSRSMEDEAHDILRCALSQEPGVQENLADAMQRLVEPFGGFELPPFPRKPLRDPPDFT
jgi:plasmid stability protein